MRFNSLLEKYLIEYNSNIIEGILYEQFNIVEKKGFYYIFNEKRDRIIKSCKSFQEAREYIDSINSGC